KKTVEIGQEPKRFAGGMTPVIGVSDLNRLELPPARRRKALKQPYLPGTPAAAARALGLGPGDRVLKATDPDDPDRLTALTGARLGPPGGGVAASASAG